MDDDLGTPAAVAVIHETVREGNGARRRRSDGAARAAGRGARDARRARARPRRPALGLDGRAATTTLHASIDALVAGLLDRARRGPGRQGLRGGRRHPRPASRRPASRSRTPPTDPKWTRAGSRCQATRSARARSRRPARATRPPGSGGASAAASRARGPTPKAQGPAEPQGPQEAKAARRARSGGRPRRRDGRKGGGDARVDRRAQLRRRGAARRACPVTAVYVAEGAERDDRLREVVRDRRRQGHLAARGAARRARPDDRRRGAPGPRRSRCRRTSTPHPNDLLDAAAATGETPLIVALDSVTDPRNLGAVVRSAAGFGAHGVRDPRAPRGRHDGVSAWKTSAGAAARVPVAQAVNLTRAAEGLPGGRAAWSIGLAADGEVVAARPRPRRRAARDRRRLRGQGPLPAGRRDLRPARLDPDGQLRSSRSTPASPPASTLYAVAQARSAPAPRRRSR